MAGAIGLVAAGLGICLVPEIAALSVPACVTTISVEDPGWLGRMTVAVTPRERAAETAAIVDALRRTGDDIHADIQLRRPDVLAHPTGDRWETESPPA